jgi:AraC family transcriptional regulator of arabinose operon
MLFYLQALVARHYLMTDHPNKTDAHAPIQLAAQFLYYWYTSPLQAPPVSEQALAAFQYIGGSPIHADELQQYKAKLHQSEFFAQTRQRVIDKWGDRIDSSSMPSEEDAQDFVFESLSKIDHANVYGDGINANVTRIERGVVQYTEMRFPGKMPCWTLHFTTQGSALFINEEMDLEVGPGDLMLFQPDANYRYGLHPGADDWEHLWVLFQPRPHWQEWLGWDQLDEQIRHLRITGSDSISALEKIFRELIALNDDPGPYRRDLQYTRLEEVLIRARDFTSLPRQTETDSRVEDACHYMQANLAQRVSIDEVAVVCNLSPSRLSHLFKQQMGVSPKHWSNNIRLQAARKLLLSTNDSVTAIARKIGYEDPNQFTKYFTKNQGCSPREFRRSFEPRGSTHLV